MTLPQIFGPSTGPDLRNSTCSFLCKKKFVRDCAHTARRLLCKSCTVYQNSYGLWSFDALFPLVTLSQLVEIVLILLYIILISNIQIPTSFNVDCLAIRHLLLLDSIRMILLFVHFRLPNLKVKKSIYPKK